MKLEVNRLFGFASCTCLCLVTLIAIPALVMSAYAVSQIDNSCKLTVDSVDWSVDRNDFDDADVRISAFGHISVSQDALKCVEDAKSVTLHRRLQETDSVPIMTGGGRRLQGNSSIVPCPSYCSAWAGCNADKADACGSAASKSTNTNCQQLKNLKDPGKKPLVVASLFPGCIASVDDCAEAKNALGTENPPGSDKAQCWAYILNTVSGKKS